jgi:hypothetical protein
LAEPEKPGNKDTTDTHFQLDEPTNEDSTNVLIQTVNPQTMEECKDELELEGNTSGVEHAVDGLANADVAEYHEKKANKEESKVEEANLPEEPTRDSNEKKTKWRSAIDAATGRTYYYVKGTQKVTWEKPSELSRQ